MKLSMMFWNIHGAASAGWSNGYEIPKFVVDKIMDEKKDVIILCEFVISKGWDYLQEQLEKNGYIWMISAQSGRNGMLMAFSSKVVNPKILKNNIHKRETVLSTLGDTTESDYFDVCLEIDEKRVHFIDTRIMNLLGERTKEEKEIFKKKQMKEIEKYFSTIPSDEAFICAGDWNMYSTQLGDNINHLYRVKMPKWTKEKEGDLKSLDTWSFVCSNGNKLVLDYLLYKNVSIETIHYDGWTFVEENEAIYHNRKKDEYKSDLLGLPDHDILYMDVKL